MASSLFTSTRRSIAKAMLSPGRCFFGSTTALCDAASIKLHTEWIVPEGTKTDRAGQGEDYTILFMHGLLGNGRNLKTFAKKLVKQQSSNHGSCRGGILTDLRGHGQSYQNQRTEETNNIGNNNHDRTSTFRDCAGDVQKTLEAFHSDELVPPTSVLVGHSFGGRLALEYAANVVHSAATTIDNADTKKDSLKAVWLLDTVPGQANESVDKVLATITTVLEDSSKNSANDEPLSKKEMVGVLTNPPHDMDLPTAQWLAMSYDEKTGDNFGFDNDLVTRLKPEFANQDFMGLLRQVLGSNPADGDRDTNSHTICVHIVRAGMNPGWSIPILSELEKLKNEHPTTFHLHVLPSAGHNVHIDDLPGLMKLFSRA